MSTLSGSDRKTPARAERAPRWALIVSAIVAVLGLSLGGWFVSSERTTNRALNGVRVGTIDVAGFDRQEIEARLRAWVEQRAAHPITVTLARTQLVFEPKDAGLSIDAPATAERALAVGRRGSVLTRFAAFIARRFRLELRFDPSRLSSLLDAWQEASIKDAPFAGGLAVAGTTVTALYPHSGTRLDRPRIVEQLRSTIAEGGVAATLATRVEAPGVERAEVDRIVAQAQSMVAADIELSSSDGTRTLRLTAAQVGSLLKVESHAVHGKLALACAPEVTKQLLDAERSQLEEQPQNIHHIADLLDGTLVRAGETFSVNQAIGPRTVKNGFRPAPSIEDGDMVDTVGGGVSQFATTLFNALFYGGYDILERQPHSYWFTRYPMGYDATLSYPHPDIVFKNDSDAAVLIKTQYTDTTITVKVYGDNGGRRVRAEVSERQNIVPPPVEFIPNPRLDADQEKTREGGMIGWTVTVKRTLIFSDGKTKEERRKVTYKPRARRVEVHPCRIPEGEPGHTGERCPKPDKDEASEPADASAK